MAHQQRSRLSDGLTRRNRFVEILKAQEEAAPPIESHAQGLAHLLRQGLAGYNRSKDDRDRTAVADVFRAGSAGEGGYQGGLDAIAAGDFSGNEYAGQYQDHYAPILEQRRYTEAQADKAFSRQQSLRAPRQRRIITGADGYQYYENGERVLPNAQSPNAAFRNLIGLNGTTQPEAATGQDHPLGTPVGVSDQSPGLRFPTAAAQQGPVAASLMPEGSAPQAQLGPLATRLGDMPPVHPPSTPLSFGNLLQTQPEPVNPLRARYDALPDDIKTAMRLPGADALGIFNDHLTQEPTAQWISDTDRSHLQVNTETGMMRAIPLSPEEIQAKKLEVAREIAMYKPFTDSQSKAGTFGLRMAGAEKTINDILAGGYDPTNIKDRSASNIYGGNFIISEEGQRFEQAKRDWVTANLRKESGAVIGVDEMAAEILKYLPVAGDSDATIRQKARSRERAFVGMVVSSGRAYEEMSKEYEKKFGTVGTDTPSASGWSIRRVD